MCVLRIFFFFSTWVCKTFRLPAYEKNMWSEIMQRYMCYTFCVNLIFYWKPVWSRDFQAKLWHQVDKFCSSFDNKLNYFKYMTAQWINLKVKFSSSCEGAILNSYLWSKTIQRHMHGVLWMLRKAVLGTSIHVLFVILGSDNYIINDLDLNLALNVDFCDI